MGYHLSHSKMEKAKTCPLSFWFGYVAKFEPEIRVKDYSKPGRCVHQTIENTLKAIQDSPIDVLKSTLNNTTQEMYNKEYYELGLSEQEADKSIRNLDNWLDFMKRRIDYCEGIDMMDHYFPTLVEPWLEKNIAGVEFRGKLDAMFQDQQDFPIDWKTSSSTKITELEVKQATRYAILLGPNFGPNKDQHLSSFYIINLNKRPVMNKCKVNITIEMIREQEQEIILFPEFVDRGYFPKNKSYNNCLFCDYKMRCAQYDEEGRLRV